MLQSASGATIAAMMQQTGWQQHSVRGFLAGVVRKRLKLKLNSKKVDGNRVYRIDHGTEAEAAGQAIQAPRGLTGMPRVKVGPALPDARTLDVEIARLRDLDIGGLQVRWQNVFRRRPPPHLPRHLLFRVLAYRLQADRLGDLMPKASGCSMQPGLLKTPANARSRSNRQTTEIRPGTMLAREWNGRMQRVAVLADGFAWNGKTYPSLSKVAQAITGTRWNGPRFFGLRDKPSEEAQSS